MAALTQRHRVPALPSEAGQPRATREAAIARLLEGVGDEGTRILVLGATRSGKTSLCRHLVRAIIAGPCDRVVIHDAKYADRAQYDGASVYSPAELRTRFESMPITIERSQFGAADASDVVKSAALAGVKTCLFLDEGSFALRLRDDGEVIEQSWAGGSLGWLQLQGGGVGASVVSCWQLLRQAPGSAVDSARWLVCCGLGGRSLAYAVDLRFIPREAQQTIQALKPGEFCLFSADREWDRTVYYSPER